MRSIIAPPPDGLPKKYASVAKHIKNKAKVEMEIDIDFNGKVAPTPQVQAQKRKSNPKIAYIQKVVSAPSSNDGKKLGDGMWGGKTTTAWEKWISSPATLEKIKALIATDSLDESKFLNLDLLFEGSPKPAVSTRVSDDPAAFITQNKGNAAEIAKHMGYSPSLAGVHDLITALEAGHRRYASLGSDNLDGPDADADADDALATARDARRMADEWDAMSDDEKREAFEASADVKMLATAKDARRMADEWDAMSDDEKREAFEAQALANARDPEFDWAGEMDIRDEEDASEEEDDVPQSDAEILAQSPGDLEESHSHGWLIRNRYRRY
jgi:hypothetical protein